MRVKGFTFIDVIIGTVLVLIVFLGIFAAYQLGLKVVGMSKNKIIATSLANAEIEKIRNLPYQSIGVQGSFPNGLLPRESEVIQNNVRFKIERRVDYVVDSADGISPPADDCPNDYKRVQIKVSSLDSFSAVAIIATDIAPKDIVQECGELGGILSVSVFDAYGAMVSSPLIEIKDPATDQTIKTASPISGQYYFPLAPSTYKIVVSKEGYSSERSYGQNELTFPAKPHPIVLEGKVVETSFSIDKVSSLTLQTRGIRDLGYPVISNVSFSLRGEKIIGLDSQENPVYKYSQNHQTNGAGEITINNLEWDSYYFSVSSPDLNLVEIESPPGTTSTQPVGLAPDSSLTVRLILSAQNSLLVNVQNMENSSPIFSAKVRLFSTALGYDATQYTDETGKSYFIPLKEANYNLEIEGPGYASTSTTIFVSGQATTTIQLQQIE